MKEIEVKILDIDPKVIVAKLKELGAKKDCSGIVKVTAFDFPDGRLLEDDSYVRVRTVGHGQKTELVLKKKIERDKFKVMEEVETTVGDYGTAVQLFERIGMDAFAKQEKYRAEYTVGSIKFEIDKYPLVPWYVEVEAPTEEEVEKGVRMLGYDMSQTTSMDGATLLRSHGHDSKFFTFKEKGESSDYDGLFE